ncbi:MAG: hypothetical protein NUK65_13110, partial [Firmicutes bacterium]|nr:hypothetical protein [Bacillota bacterium]
MTKTFLAYFQGANDANEAKQILQEKIFTVATKSYDAQLEDPNLSASSLMVGYLPNLAHGIFGTTDVVATNSGAYLLTVVDEDGHEEEVKQILQEFNGNIVQE